MTTPGARSTVASRVDSRLVARGALAVADQGLTAAAGLLVTVVMARALDPGAFGAFSIGIATLLLLSTVHDALILEPMSVLARSRHATRLAEYLDEQTRAHLVLTGALGGVVAVAGFVAASAGAAEIGRSLVASAVALPFVLLQWLARRRAYVVGRPLVALAASAVTLATLAATLGALRVTNATSIASAWTAWGGASLVGSLVALRATGARRRAGGRRWRAVLAEHLTYGRWIVLASAIVFAGTQAQLFVAAGALGVVAAGQLRAFQVIVLPLSRATAALIVAALPGFAADAARGRIDRVRARARTLTIALVGTAVTYEAILILGAPALERALYGGRFAAEAGVIPILGLVPILQALTAGPGLALRASRRPRHYPIVAAATAALGLGSALILPFAFGLAGAAWSIVLGYAGSAVATRVMDRRWTRAPLTLVGAVPAPTEQVSA